MRNRWMYDHRYQFGKESRVRLRTTVDPSIYGEFACVGNEGIVGDRRKDRFGLPEVYIQWDRNHWAYNGVSDCWTFEDHFELVEDNMDNKREQINELTSLFADGMARILGGGEGEEPSDNSSEREESLTNRFLTASQTFSEARPNKKRDAYTKAVQEANDRLQTAEAFIVVGVDQQAPDQPFAVGYSRTTEGDILLTSYMAAVAARAHQALALQAIAQISEE